MPIPRYFKLNNFILKDGFDLELSEIQLKDNTDTVLPFTVTTNQSPLSGVIENLNDGLTTQICSFAKEQIAWLEITLDLGADIPSFFLNNLLIGSGTGSDTYPLVFSVLTSSNNTTWTDLSSVFTNYGYVRSKFPGVLSLQDTNTLSLIDKQYNFDYSYPKYVSTVLRKDGQIELTHRQQTNQSTVRPLGCRPLRTGKWYFEIVAQDFTGGVTGEPSEIAANTKLGMDATYTSSAVGFANGTFYTLKNGSEVYTPVFSRPGSVADLKIPYGICIDLDNLTICARRSNVNSPTIAIKPSVTGNYYPALGTYLQLSNSTGILNLGSVPFDSTLPAGYLPLRDFFASTVALEKQGTLFDVMTYMSGDMRTEHLALTTPTSELTKTRHAFTSIFGERKGYIKGNVYIDSVPSTYVARFVTLVDSRSRNAIDSTWSNAITGEYLFEYVDESRTYYTWTFDPGELLPPTITGPMKAERMPVFA